MGRGADLTRDGHDAYTTSGAVWRPRPILSSWTSDQAAAAAHLPKCRRLCIPAANGVGKTFLAADLVASFIADLPAASVIITAPTNRQVSELLWPLVTERLLALGLAETTWQIPIKPRWSGGDADHLIGFATNTAQRMQGFHAANLLIIMDEASGMPENIVNALEGIAVGSANYIIAIGNPNSPSGPFWAMTRKPSWTTHTISALTHPNITSRNELIPGATTYGAMVDRIADWCKEVAAAGADDFTIDTPDGPKHYSPNDEFRIRYLGRFPSAASWSLYSQADINGSFDREINGSSPVIAALDVARQGGDRTIYGLRVGDTVRTLKVIQAADLMSQAQEIAARLREDAPECIVVDAAGLGIGLVDRLRQLTDTPVIAFQGASEPTSPAAKKKYANRRAMAYGNLAIAMRASRCSIPRENQLADELAAIKYTHSQDGRMIIEDKAKCSAQLGRSPDAADTVSLLWDRGTDFTWHSAQVARVEEALW